MNIQKEIKLLLLPLVKSFPVILALVVIGLMGMRRAITLMTPVYQADGAIKINNLEYTQSSFLLFGKEDGAQHQQNQSFLTEVEIFRSRDLIRETLRTLNWELGVYRIGRFRLVELGEECPFKVYYQALNRTVYQQPLQIFYKQEDQFLAINPAAGDSIVFSWQDTIHLGAWSLHLAPKEDVLTENPGALRPGDAFQLKLYSLEEQVEQVNGSNLFVKPVEKDVSIIKIYYKHERPEKARDFVNELMQTYITQCRLAKAEQTDTTLMYLDEQLVDIRQSLVSAEEQLAFFRTQSGLVDTKLETDAQLRTISQLDFQKMNIQLRKGELEQLYQYLLEGHELVDFSPNLETLQDPVFRESFLQLQRFELQRQDLLQQYVPTSEEVQNMVSKINKTRTFLYESIRKSLANLDYQLAELGEEVTQANDELYSLPEKEKQQVSLQRTVALNEAMYNYLVRKRTELAINRSSNLYPHKIVDQAQLPGSLAAPNKPLLYGLAILLALMAGMLFAYLRHYFTARVRYAEDLEERLEVPVLAAFFRQPKRPGFPFWAKKEQLSSFALSSNLMANLSLVKKDSTAAEGQLLLFTSMTPGEGKSFVCQHLAQALAAAGQRVLLIDADLRHPRLHHQLGVLPEGGVMALLAGKASTPQTTTQAGLWLLPAGQPDEQQLGGFYREDVKAQLRAWKSAFDFILVDTPPVGLFQELTPWMQLADLNLFVLRADYTRTRLLRSIKKQLDELSELHLALLLNDTLRERTLPGYRRLLKRYHRPQAIAV